MMISDDIYISSYTSTHWSLTISDYEFSIENYSSSEELISDILRHSIFLCVMEIQQIISYYRIFNAR